MTLLRDSFGNEHRATPAIFALKEVPWIRIARTILSIFAANAQQSFPQGILSFLFFSIHLLRGFDLRNPFAAKFKTTPAHSIRRERATRSPRRVMPPFFSLCPVALLFGTSIKF